MPSDLESDHRWFANIKGTFLDLLFTNVPVDIAVQGANTPLLKLTRHHKAYKVEMQICCGKFE
jgi:hypothetical protein